MKGIYAHTGTDEINLIDSEIAGTDEPLGSGGQIVWQPSEGMDWIGALDFMRQSFPGKSFTIYEFSSFYDEETYEQRYVYHGENGMSPALL